MHMLRRFILVLFLICPLMIGGCSQGETETDLLADNDESLIYEETISPNEDYVSSQDDIVYYTIRFYQDEDDKITVTADSNALLLRKWNMRCRQMSAFQKKTLKLRGRR